MNFSAHYCSEVFTGQQWVELKFNITLQIRQVKFIQREVILKVIKYINYIC